MRLAGHAVHMGEKMSAYRTLVRKSERRKLQGRQNSEWDDNIKIELLDAKWGDVDWNH
jgi:hypothetical protein